MALTGPTFTGAPGATATTANTGFSAVSITDTNGSYVFTDAWKPHGADVCLQATKSTTSGQIYGTIVIAATDMLSYRQPLTVVTMPTVAGDIGLFWAGVGSTRYIAVTYNSAGAIRLQDASGFIWISANGVIQAGRQVILYVAALRHATAGTLRVVVKDANTLTVLADSTVFTNRNTGAAGYTHIRTSGAGTGSGTIAMVHRWGEPRWDIETSLILPDWQAHQPVWMRGPDGQPQAHDMYIGGASGEPILVSGA